MSRTTGLWRSAFRLVPAAGAAVALNVPRVCRADAAPSWWNPLGRNIATASAGDASKASIPAIKMFQYEICPFCNKIKAVLDFYKVPYTTVEVNPLTKKEFKVTKELPADHPAHGYKRVPFVSIGGEIVADSPVILERVVKELTSAGVISAKSAKEFADPKVQEWVKWSDSKLAVLLFPNLTRTYGESYQAFGYVMDAPNFSMADKYSNLLAGSLAMWAAQGKIKKKYNITDERKALNDCIADWVAGVGGKEFMGGADPNLADLAVFGTLRAVEGSETHKVIMQETELKPWYDRMAARVGERSCARTGRTAE